MCKEPKISIITPSYNQGNYLEETILSVINQNYPNLEYIVIDGGSTDNSIDIIKKYQDKIKYWISEKDGGQSEAINKGFKIATGEIIAWINSDDMYGKNTFIEVANAYSSLNSTEQNTFWIIGDCQAFGSLSWKFQAMEFSTNNLIEFWKNNIGQPSVFWRANLIANPILNEELHYSMDLDLWLRLSRISKPIILKKILSFARYYSETKTATGQHKRYREILNVLLENNRIENGFTEKYIIQNLKKNFYSTYYHSTIISSLNDFRLQSLKHWKPTFTERLRISLKIIFITLKYIFGVGNFK
ncbi:glycosyltransferase family 2 protein [Pedobacter lithocola]|uniref:Glycosyltransferase family 2 protein n=1 Tax=Pedobacter lithocola TaxID=1908239 RepID=A0ABV8P7P1_9SPHI